MSHRITLHVLVLFFSLLAGLTARADHLVGGELFYECLGNNQYRITLIIYRDCFSTGADFDSNPVLTIFQGASQFNNTVWSGFTSSPIPVSSEDPCFITPSGICVEKAIYERVISLPPSASGYTIVHQRCCRGPGIINLNNPQAQGNTYTIDIPPNDVDCNSSAYFNELPPIAICVNEPFVFDHSATEADGDELVYTLCDPLNGGTTLNPMPDPAAAPPYDPVNWGPGFSADNPIMADPAFSIDPNTGLLTGTPVQTGKYTVGVCVSEYRNGVLLSTTMRDFQFNVVPCSPTVIAEPILQNSEPCSGFTFQFSNQSFGADDFLWDFGVEGDDSAISTEFAPEYTYADTGVYTVMLIANPGISCNDTAFIEVSAFPEVNVSIDEVEFICEGGQQWIFSALGNFDPEVSEILWDFGQGAIPATSDQFIPPPVSYESPGLKNVSITVNQFGCEDNAGYLLEVPEAPSAGIAPQEEFCQGFTVVLENESSGSQSYEWFFGDASNPEATANSFNATYTYPTSGIYEVMLVVSAENACPDTAVAVIEVAPLLDVYFDPPAVQCLEGNQFVFEPMGAFEEDAIFTWILGDTTETTVFQSAQSASVSFNEPGSYPVTVTVSNGVCEDTYTAFAIVDPDPVADFSAAVLSGCAPLVVAFENLSVGSQGLTYNWAFGDGNISSSPFPIHTYEEPGVYTVQLQVNSFSGCVGEASEQKVAYIEVLEVPQAGFLFDPASVDIFNPETQIINQSEDDVACSYLFEDSTVWEGCSFPWVFEEAGTHTVWQTVTSENGCQATFSSSINVLGHLFYAPNAFSPNGDGINDIYRPEALGVKSFEMRIVNRLGEEIFKSDDLGFGWNGTVNGSNYIAQPGVYVYVVRLQDMQGINHDYQGRVTLVR